MPLMREMIIRRTELALEDFDALVSRTPPDRIEWKPEGAKSVLEIVRECAEVNERWASILRNGHWVGYDLAREAPSLMPTIGIARTHLRTTTGLFTAEVRRFPQERMSVKIPVPWGEVDAFTALTWAMWHLSYHEGQVAYLQTMWGDLEE